MLENQQLCHIVCMALEIEFLQIEFISRVKSRAVHRDLPNIIDLAKYFSKSLRTSVITDDGENATQSPDAITVHLAYLTSYPWPPSTRDP